MLERCVREDSDLFFCRRHPARDRHRSTPQKFSSAPRLDTPAADAAYQQWLRTPAAAPGAWFWQNAGPDKQPRADHDRGEGDATGGIQSGRAAWASRRSPGQPRDVAAQGKRTLVVDPTHKAIPPSTCSVPARMGSRPRSPISSTRHSTSAQPARHRGSSSPPLRAPAVMPSHPQLEELQSSSSRATRSASATRPEELERTSTASSSTLHPRSTSSRDRR